MDSEGNLISCGNQKNVETTYVKCGLYLVCNKRRVGSNERQGMSIEVEV